MAIKIIAATGCPTGIAHTFMAQEALEQAAKRHGVQIKVETHGQVGIENALTEKDIAEADGVIVAADKDVQAERFAGKKVIDVSVSKAIKDPDVLIEQIISGNVPVYRKGKGAAQKSEAKQEVVTGSGSSIGHTIYKHLMNGVSHMLPFVVAGGVLTAVSFLFGIYSYDPKSPQYNEFAAILKTIGGMGMNLMVPVLCAYIAESVAKRPGLVIGFIAGMIAFTNGTGFLGGIIGGFLAGYIMLGLQWAFSRLPKMFDGLKAIFLYPVIGLFIVGLLMWVLSSPMEAINKSLMSFLSGFEHSNPILLGIIIGCMSAFDMGGPVNKAAYVTGTMLLGQGNFYFMAGVSAACITPPLITGFAALFNRKYFDKSERNAAYVNFILGSTHITEGAIPFAAKNPLVVIPILMVGSSISAVLTYLFKVQVPAPHGGFLVLPVVTHPFLWVVAILCGSLVGGFLFGLSRRVSAKKNGTIEEDTEMSADIFGGEVKNA
ncbi:fructose-specific PTS transporter subunit EIIC [Weizmannia acidiproducens]|uniref:PTS fructose transporter subunit IIC n=1 Tax=Heyndrickxia acidiproducens TaxID=1121084 RepID=UPI00035CA28E